MAWLWGLVPEYSIAVQAETDSDISRRADRKRALVDGFRRARGAAPVSDENGKGNDTGNGNGNAVRHRPPEVA